MRGIDVQKPHGVSVAEQKSHNGSSSMAQRMSEITLKRLGLVLKTKANTNGESEKNGKPNISYFEALGLRNAGVEPNDIRSVKINPLSPKR